MGLCKVQLFCFISSSLFISDAAQVTRGLWDSRKLCCLISNQVLPWGGWRVQDAVSGSGKGRVPALCSPDSPGL